MEIRHHTQDGVVYAQLAGGWDGDLPLDPLKLKRAVGTGPSPVVIDMSQWDVAGSRDAAVLVDLVRALVRTRRRVTIHGAPQMIAHTLYKIGLLRDPCLTLVDPRNEEPYG